LLRQTIALHVRKILWKGSIRAVDANVWVEKKLPVEVEGINGALGGCGSCAARESGDQNDNFNHAAEIIS
jgi:hypothetical protein